jgi:hypothetical protein
MGDPGSITCRGKRTFPLSLCVQTSSGAHLASCTVGTRYPFPGTKAQPGHDADHSPPLVPRSRMSRSYTFSAPSAFVACSGTALALTHIQSFQIGRLCTNSLAGVYSYAVYVSVLVKCGTNILHVVNSVATRQQVWLYCNTSVVNQFKKYIYEFHNLFS